MNQHIKKVYVPMTETAFYILLCLKKPNHGYGIVQTVEKLTDGAIRHREPCTAAYPRWKRMV